MSNPTLIGVGVLAVAAALLLLRRPKPRRIGGERPPLERKAKRSPPSASIEGLQPEVASDVAEFLRQGRKIDAIKLVREATGMGLKESKEFVENIETPGD